MPIARSRGKTSYSFAGVLFGLLFLLLGYRGLNLPAKDQSTLNTAIAFVLLALGIVVLAVSGIYFRRRAKRLGILDAMNKD
jgi:ABC-type antimicrobial peptide transport system permease subunit